MEEWAEDRAVGRTVGCGSSLTEGRWAGRCGDRSSVKWEPCHELTVRVEKGVLVILKREERPEIAV